MPNLLPNNARVALVLAAIALAAAGCGRKGDLDRPSTPPEQQNIRKSNDGTGGGNKTEPVVDRPFVLDPLL